MSPPEQPQEPEQPEEPEQRPSPRERRAAASGPGRGLKTPGYGGFVAVLVLGIVVLITLNTLLSDSKQATGIAPGSRLAPFAVPLALGNLKGDADIATSADQGAAGRVPACAERGAQVLNICQLYEQGPVVLAVFVDSGSCTSILGDMQGLMPSFPGVRFAAVAIEGSRGKLRQLVRSRGITLPVGIDGDGALVALYKVESCPQVTFAYPGGVVQSKALLGGASPATLRRRVSELVQAARARGWRAPT